MHRRCLGDMLTMYVEARKQSVGLKILGRHGQFADRRQAGRLLADALRDEEIPEPLVLGVPRGGVVVSASVARALTADLDVVVARKLGAPGDPELAIGAVVEGGHTYLNEGVILGFGVESAYIEDEKKRQLAELRERLERYRRARPFVPRKGRNLIVIDDGVATGATMMATLHGLRAADPASLWCALPVGPPDALGLLAKVADEVLALSAPAFFQAVGQFYADFDQVPDSVVIEHLKASLDAPRSA